MITGLIKDDLKHKELNWKKNREKEPKKPIKPNV